MQRRVAQYSVLVLVSVYIGILVNGFGNVLWFVAHSNNPAFPDTTKNLIAALLEPTTTKLAPSIGVVAYVRYYRPALADYIATRVLRLGVLFGFLAGFVEFSLYLLQAGLLSFLVPLSLTKAAQCRIFPVFMHMITGTLVTIPVLSLIDYQTGDSIADDVPILSKHYPTLTDRLTDQFFVVLLVTTFSFLMAMLVHVWWNTGGNDILARFIGFPC